MDNLTPEDMCRVCRSGSQIGRPLFHPCICTGSIKWIHEDCLLVWMGYSKKQFCEICGHRFTFSPIYSPNMPRMLPLRYVFEALAKAARFWLHRTLVGTVWLGVVPLLTYRTFDTLFSGSNFDTILSIPFNFMLLPFEILSAKNIAADVIRGWFIMFFILISYVCLMWLKNQILNGGGPLWLQRDEILVANEAVLRAPPAPMDNEEPQPVDQEVVVDQDLGNRIEEVNLNPMDPARPEHFAWEKFLGLDGSLLFIEHAICLISLNSIFMLTFAFLPHLIGNTMINFIGLIPLDKSLLYFHELLTTLFGYCNVGIILAILYSLAQLLDMKRLRWYLGFCYVVVKFSLISVLKIGVLRVVCGWWLDICSLSMFDATIKDRNDSFHAAPATSLFIHWIFGMIYFYYFTIFISLLRQVLRPGVLWFLRNSTDIRLNPIQKLIHLPFLVHTQKVLILVVMCGSSILLTLWLPIKVLTTVWPSFLPYTLSGGFEVIELSLQLLFLKIVFPGFFEQLPTRIWMKELLRLWCNAVSSLLGIRSYLLGTSPQGNEGNNANRPQPEDIEELGAAHQPLWWRGVPEEYPPYEKPTFFAVRIFGLITLMCATLVIGSLLTITVPVWIGRQALAMLPDGTLMFSWASDSSKEPPRPHEFYTAAIGIYLCLLLFRAVGHVVNLLLQGRVAVTQKVKQCISAGSSHILTGSLLIVMIWIIPLLFGLLVELAFFIPLRVPLDQTPIHFLWQDWILGVIYTKLACTLILMGPDWKFKRAIQRAYQDGLRNINSKFIFTELFMPVFISLGLALALPYITAHTIMPIYFKHEEDRNLIARIVYPIFLVILIIIDIINLKIRQFKKLCTKIRNERYLVGEQLENYHHRN